MIKISTLAHLLSKSVFIMLGMSVFKKKYLITDMLYFILWKIESPIVMWKVMYAMNKFYCHWLIKKLLSANGVTK